ncbi:MAG TPA: hypothetical protein VM076_06785 [Gemmatimonadaceae bacterium]|nr:hypothetical protein [Gemmatimonadaceae bacterium]
MKNVVGKPLDALEPFIGEWSLEGKHVAVPDTVIRGHSVFEWWGDRTFLMQRQTLDHPDFPDSIAMMGATQPGSGLAQHYFDSRGKHRLFDMTFDGGVWTLERKAAGPDDFDQGMRATFSEDGDTITAESELRDPKTRQMTHDFTVLYRRR